jgi:hypothetical protein
MPSHSITAPRAKEHTSGERTGAKNRGDGKARRLSRLREFDQFSCAALALAEGRATYCFLEARLALKLPAAALASARKLLLPGQNKTASFTAKSGSDVGAQTLFIAYKHGVQYRMHAIFEIKPPYCTP